MFYLFNYMYIQPGFTIASHCITPSNSSYTQDGIERYLNDWTTNGVLPGFMQKNYVRILPYFCYFIFLILILRFLYWNNLATNWFNVKFG